MNVTENVRPYGVGAHRHMPEIDQELARARRASPDRLHPAPLPIDQGELLSCYVTTTRPLTQGELDELYARAYGDEPFIDLVATVPRRARRPRDQRLRAARARRRADRQGLRLRGDRQPLEGTASQAVANLNLMFGYDEGLGLR